MAGSRYAPYEGVDLTDQGSRKLGVFGRKLGVFGRKLGGSNSLFYCYFDQYLKITIMFKWCSLYLEGSFRNQKYTL